MQRNDHRPFVSPSRNARIDAGVASIVRSGNAWYLTLHADDLNAAGIYGRIAFTTDVQLGRLTATSPAGRVGATSYAIESRDSRHSKRIACKSVIDCLQRHDLGQPGRYVARVEGHTIVIELTAAISREVA